MPTRPVETRRGLVRQNHAEVEIAVRTAITTGGGAEQIDTLRVVVGHQTTRDLRDGLVLGHAPLLCTENAGTREDAYSRRMNQPGFGQHAGPDERLQCGLEGKRSEERRVGKECRS